MQDDILYWIWLAERLGPCSDAGKILLSHFPDARAVFEATSEEIAQIEELSARDKEALLRKDLEKPYQILAKCKEDGIFFLTYTNDAYPNALRDIPDPPVLLYCRGTVPDWNARPCIAVVGTRNMSSYGADTAFDISYDMARMGCITVSGMALGIDGVAAASTLAAQGKTVAVLGCGVSIPYPAAHSFLYDCILQGGGIILSEYDPFARPERQHFPQRNRLISGIAKAVIVVEGDHQSGAMITAELAAKQGRAVFAVPGRVNDVGSEAPLLLLKRGSRAISCADDIYEIYRADYPAYLNGAELLRPHKCTAADVIFRYRISYGTPLRAPDREVRAKPYVPLSEKRRATVGQKPENTAGDPPKPSDNETKSDTLIGKIFGIHSGRSKKPSEERPVQTPQANLSVPANLTEEEKKIYMAIPPGKTVYADDISVDGMSTEDILSALTLMEIEGAVISAPGGRYRRNFE